MPGFFLKKTINNSTTAVPPFLAYSFLKLALALAGLVYCLLLSSCQAPPAKVSSTHFIMDTLVQIDAYANNQVAAEAAVQKAFARMRVIHDVADRYSVDGASDCVKINNAAPRPVAVSDDLFFMVDYVLRQNRPQVNIAVGPLVDLWAVSSRKTPPDPANIATAAMLVRSSALIADNTDKTVCLSPAGASLDFGAVAKGYAIEQAAAVLAMDKNMTGILINGGGNIKVLGEKPDKQPWQIGVQSPRAPDGLLGILKLAPGEAVATSGDYQRYFEAGGRRYHHIIDPVSGYPAAENISVTVLAQDALDADYYSTLFFLLPAEQAFGIMENTPYIHAIIVDREHRIYISPGLREKFTPAQNSGWQYFQK